MCPERGTEHGRNPDKTSSSRGSEDSLAGSDSMKSQSCTQARTEAEVLAAQERNHEPAG